MKKSLLSIAVAAMLMAGIFSGCTNSGGSADMYNTKSKPATEINSKMALAWGDMLLDQVRSQRAGPPHAARAMAYFGVALYQSVMPGIKDAHSLVGQLAGLDKLPEADKNQEYDWETVLNNSCYMVVDEGLARFMGPNTPNLKNLRDKNNHLRDSLLANKEVFDRSKKYGEDLGNAIVAYMKTDQFDYTREHNEYDNPSRIGHQDWYELTDVDKPVFEPFWGTLRPLGIDTTELCMMNPTVPYDTTKGSSFYKFAEELYGVDTSFTEYNRITALYWADDPIETFTPPGHWMKIAKQQIRNHGYNLAQTAELFCYLGMGEYDASISVWKMKYEINLLRPKTYIAETMNKPDWEPYLETPPFPEYPSGHSGFSGAAAQILTHYFGDVEFTDSTDMVLGLNPRHFTSFNAAADEAASSRKFGGIHYEAAIKDGVTTGRCIADKIMSNVKLGSGTATTASK